MRGINKQKFLTELGRLLTFMYEEDRERALAMYASIFDETDDETGVLQMLVSPTRQAVNLARSYDARERKLQVQAQSRGEAADADEPAFVQVIEKLRDQAAALGAPVNKVSADQFSLFEDAARESTIFDEVGTAPAEESEDFFGSPVTPAPASAAEEAPAAPAKEPAATNESAAPAEEPAAPADESVSERLQAFLDSFAMQDEETAKPVTESGGDDFSFDASPAEAPESAQEERQGSIPGATRPAPVPPPMPETPTAEAVTPLQESFSAPPQPAPEPQPAPAPVPQPEKPRSEIRAGARPLFTRSKPRVGLLILFLLLAVPITLLCILVLLAPAALALGVGAFAGWLGFSGLLATFGSFSVFADILLVFGCTLIVLGLAILFLWIFIWLVFGVVPGLIRGVCALARRWCYKEVPV